MATDLEQREALVQTRMLIDREPSNIVIVRPAPDVADGAGGRTRGAGTVTLVAQRCFVSGVTRDSDYRQSSFSSSDRGESYTNVIEVVGLPGLNINEYDTFMWQGDLIKVDFVFPSNGYEVRAQGRRVSGGGR